MRMVGLNSSLIKAVGYNRVTHTLRVEFLTGKTYDYKDVPEVVYLKLARAASPGEEYNKNIKNNYGYEIVDSDLVTTKS